MPPQNATPPEHFPTLKATCTPAAKITGAEGGAARLQIPGGPQGIYRLAQWDDYARLPRRAFAWQPPLSLRAELRASARDLPGTWGIGLWNDPFSLTLGMGGGARRFPVLPQCAWFFFASPPNFLSLYDDQPAYGALASVWQSRPLPTPLLALFTAPALPLLTYAPSARLLRRVVRQFVRQSACSLTHNPCDWHTYEIIWRAHNTQLRIDGEVVCDTSLSPRAPLGFVLWLDNQYMAWQPNGKLSAGTLASAAEGWLEVRNLFLQKT
ncbi:MAG: hypothetical protein OHK0052_12470 [Anaerolineales bacterium]